MYLKLIFCILLTFSTVSGDFEEIRFRQYSPAIEVEALIDYIYKEGVLKKDDDIIRNSMITQEQRGFQFIDCERYTHSQLNNFNSIIHSRFELDTSNPPEINDIQFEHENTMRFPPSKVDEVRFDIGVSVRWSGLYLYLKFWQVKSRNYLKLAEVFCVTAKVNWKQFHRNNLAGVLIRKMIELEEDVLAPGFAYQTCDNRTIRNGTELVEEKFRNITIDVIHVIHFYKSTHKFIQSEIIGYDGKKHLFEFDSFTNQIIKGMEYRCDEEQTKTISFFDKILHRQYEPAIHVQSICNRIIMDIRNERFIKDISSSFEFVDMNTEIHGIYGFKEAIRKSPTFSLRSQLKVIDVQNRELNEEDISYTGGEGDSVRLFYVYSTVKFGENSFLLKFKRMKKDNNLSLTYARYYPGSIRLQFAYDYDNVMGYIIGLGNREDVVDSKFVYRSCQNGTITDAYDLTVFPEDAFGITDLVTFKNENQNFIQFEIIVNDRTHYFEINDSTRKFTKGMEYPC